MKIANVGMQFAGGPLQVISADGLPVKPFDEHRLLIGVAETDFTEDLKKFDVPTLILHGDDDQIGASALASAKLVRNATLKIYAGAPHGLAYTQKDQLDADLLAFLKT